MIGADRYIIVKKLKYIKKRFNENSNVKKDYLFCKQQFLHKRDGKGCRFAWTCPCSGKYILPF